MSLFEITTSLSISDEDFSTALSRNRMVAVLSYSQARNESFDAMNFMVRTTNASHHWFPVS
jgi:hypothetical protein